MKDQPMKTIDVHELKNSMEQSSKLCLIDVREQEEWDSIHIPGALHIPKDTLTSCIQSKIPDLSQPIYLHCRSGVRSAHCAQNLLAMGYQEVYSVDGGILDWARAGYPTKSHSA